MNGSRSTLLVASCLAVAPAFAGDGEFTVIGIPDTQNYSEDYPAIFLDQTSWVVANMEAFDIRFVTHFGDLVQHADLEEEWINADDAMVLLDAAGVPQGVTSGNHDITPNGLSGEPYIPQNYLDFFGPQRYADEPYFMTASPTGMSSWQIFEGDDAVAKVASFCAEFMSDSADSCVRQLTPHVEKKLGA